jgi:hypothetical protein
MPEAIIAENFNNVDLMVTPVAFLSAARIPMAMNRFSAFSLSLGSNLPIWHIGPSIPPHFSWFVKELLVLFQAVPVR